MFFSIDKRKQVHKNGAVKIKEQIMQAVFPIELLRSEIDDKLSFHLLVGIICNTATNWLNTTIHLKNYRTHCVESSN